MVLHLTHGEGGFGVTFNDFTKDSGFYTTTSRFVSYLGDFSHVRTCGCLRMILRTRPRGHRPRIIAKRCRLSRRSMLGVVVDSPPRTVSLTLSHQETTPLSLPHLNRLFESCFVWDENSVPNDDVVTIPSQHKVTQQILSHWQPFLDLKLMSMDSCHVEQLTLRSQHHIVDTVEDSVLYRLMVAGKFIWMRWETISVLVPLIRVPKRLMTGWLINWLTFSVQHIQSRRNM